MPMVLDVNCANKVISRTDMENVSPVNAMTTDQNLHNVTRLEFAIVTMALKEISVTDVKTASLI
jgi:hypothetical protein